MVACSLKRLFYGGMFFEEGQPVVIIVKVTQITKSL